MRHHDDLDPMERAAVNLAIGRIFRLASRPTQPGDVEQYEQCRALILDILDPDYSMPTPYRANWARDRLTGAQGD